MSSLIKLSISDALKALKNKEFTASELVNSHIEQAQKNKHLNFYITETFDKAINLAKLADQNYSTGKERRLEGIPIGVKDLFLTDFEQADTSSGTFLFIDVESFSSKPIIASSIKALSTARSVLVV